MRCEPPRFGLCLFAGPARCHEWQHTRLSKSALINVQRRCDWLLILEVSRSCCGLFFEPRTLDLAEACFAVICFVLDFGIDGLIIFSIRCLLTSRSTSVVIARWTARMLLRNYEEHYNLSTCGVVYDLRCGSVCGLAGASVHPTLRSTWVPLKSTVMRCFVATIFTALCFAAGSGTP